MDNRSNENVTKLEQSTDMLTDLIRNHARHLIKEALSRARDTDWCWTGLGQNAENTL